MSREQETETQTLIGPKSNAEILQDLKRAETNEDNQKIERELQGSLERIAEKELEVLTGKDIPFDPMAFIKLGVVRRENLQILPGLIVDMETITQQRRAFAEKMVKAHFGESVEDNTYRTIFDTALLAMAITRINSQDFPSPNLLKLSSKESTAAVEGKGQLFTILLDSPQEMLSTLTAIYNNLAGAGDLVVSGEPVIKK